MSVSRYSGTYSRVFPSVTIKNGKEYSVYNVTEFDFASFKVADEDSVSVDSILPRYSNMVELKGAAFRPGKYQLGGEITNTIFHSLPRSGMMRNVRSI